MDLAQCLPESTQAKIHTEYNYPDADLTIATSDGQLFRVHSLLMSLASGFFKTMLSLPKGDNSQSDENGGRLTVSEDGIVWKPILDIIYPNQVFLSSEQQLSSSTFQKTWFAVEKYEMATVMRVLRSKEQACLSVYPPILAYAVACNLGWEEEAKNASAQSLSCNIMSDDSQGQLKQTSVEHALRLLQLHFSRRNLLIASLNLDDGDIGRNQIMETYHPDCRILDDGEPARWIVFKHRVLEEMEQAPSGSQFAQDEFWNGKEFCRLWQLDCHTCKKDFVQRDGLRRALVAAVDRLPKSL